MLKRFLKKIYVFVQKEVESSYVGTKTEWEMSHTLYANVQTAANKLTGEIYGERVTSMLSVMCAINAELNEGDRISFDSSGKSAYKVVSIMRYSTHKTALAEVII